MTKIQLPEMDEFPPSVEVVADSIEQAADQVDKGEFTPEQVRTIGVTVMRRVDMLSLSYTPPVFEKGLSQLPAKAVRKLGQLIEEAEIIENKNNKDRWSPKAGAVVMERVALLEAQSDK